MTLLICPSNPRGAGGAAGRRVLTPRGPLSFVEQTTQAVVHQFKALFIEMDALFCIIYVLRYGVLFHVVVSGGFSSILPRSTVA